MALRLAKTTAEGFSIEYWRIDPRMSVCFTTGAQSVQANVLAYVNATTRQAGKPAVRVSPRSIEGADAVGRVGLEGAEATAALVGGDPRAAMYAKLKALEFFAGSADC
jgi:hypothetical protein